MRRSLVLLTLPLAALLAGCPREEDPCSNDNQKRSLHQVVASWYLYPELLPALDPGAYAGPAELLDALTADARAAGMDRGWSYLASLTAQQQYFDAGTSVGFGLGFVIRGSQLFVTQVFPASPAADVGFVRGDEITHVGDDAASLVAVADLLAQDPGGSTVSEAFGPGAAGVSRTLAVNPAGGGAAVQRTMTKRTYGLDPVSWSTIDRQADGLPPAGYLRLRSFIGPADAKLRQAFAAFGTAGVTDVVVDVRYNGGGLLSTSELLADLLGGDLAGRRMYAMRNNAFHAASDVALDFVSQPEALSTPGRVAFVVTGASASASELVPVVLEAYRGGATPSIALVGHQTHGKPVGQRAFVSERCDAVLYLVSLRLENAQGDRDWFSGLPYASFSGCGIPADDDLGHEPGDALEASTAAALDWLRTGTCSPAPTPLAARPEDRYPAVPRPTVAQRNQPGLF